MGRVNKLTAGVFTSVVGDYNNTPGYTRFINTQDELNKPSEELSNYLETYKFTTDNNKVTLNYLAHLEDLIMQMRTKENLSPKDIKFNLVREYIYARIPFHRRDKNSKDIRVIVGQISEWGKKPWVNPRKKDQFETLATEKLVEAMDLIISESKVIVNNLNQPN